MNEYVGIAEANSGLYTTKVRNKQDSYWYLICDLEFLTEMYSKHGREKRQAVVFLDTHNDIVSVINHDIAYIEASGLEDGSGDYYVNTLDHNE